MQCNVSKFPWEYLAFLILDHTLWAGGPYILRGIVTCRDQCHFCMQFRGLVPYTINKWIAHCNMSTVRDLFFFGGGEEGKTIKASVKTVSLSPMG